MITNTIYNSVSYHPEGKIRSNSSLAISIGQTVEYLKRPTLYISISQADVAD